MTFTLDQLTALARDAANGFAGKLDLDHVGLLGHSFGGATALDVCQRERRCAGAVDLDGSPFGAVEQTGLGKPMMGILSEPPTEGDLAMLRRVAAATPQGGASLLAIAGTRHFNFADDAVTLSPLRLFGLLGPIDGSRGLQITRDYVRAFFDTYLRGSRSPSSAGRRTCIPRCAPCETWGSVAASVTHVGTDAPLRGSPHETDNSVRQGRDAERRAGRYAARCPCEAHPIRS